MHKPHPIRGQRTNEELFFEYRPKLVGWAMQLTHLDRADADDLVQDFYIQVTHINIILEEVDEVEPYLFKILRNLHYSRLRRNGRSPMYDLSIVDYDSLEWGLAAVDRRGLFLVRANLKDVCEFVCERKNTSRAASIFILRFLLGYYPSEVMKVALITRVSVDKSLQFARREAQLYLDKPKATRSIVRHGHPGILSGQTNDDSHGLFLELRQMVFNSCEGPCFHPSWLERCYSAEPPARFTVQELAHLVSCRSCLDRANAVLGLSLLDERSPNDTIGRENPPGPGDSEGPKLSFGRGAKRVAGPKERKALDRKLCEFFEHRPASLEVAVNGDLRTSQRVTAEISELHLKLSRTEEPNFIEVFSEQGIRLAYLHVMEPTLYPGLEQRESIALSDGRSLDLTLSFANDLPTVHVVYQDPLFMQIAAMEDEDEFNIFVAPDERHELQEPDESSPQREVKFPIRGWISSLRDKLSRIPVPLMNPLFTSAMILAFASVVCFLLWVRNSPGMSAKVFLDRAQTREASTAMNAQPGVVFQKVRIKTTKRTSERALYRDIQRHRRAKERALDADDARLRAKLTVAGVDWNDPLSAIGYRDWRNREAVQGDSVTRTGPDRLTITTSVKDDEVVSESLTVRESDFHAIGKSIELKDYGTVEIAELEYSVLPWSSVNPDLFEPLAEAQPVIGKHLHASLVPHLPIPLSVAQMDEAELGARLVLNRLHLDTSERIKLNRETDGVHIQGIVDSDDEKHQLQAQLYMVPHVLPSILTIREIASRPNAGSEITSIHESSASAAVPSALERYFAERNMEQAIGDASDREFAESSFAVNHESREIASLLEEFSSSDRLTGNARITLSELLIQHKAGLLAALGKEERQLLALELIPHPASAPDNIQGNADALQETAKHNSALCDELISGSAASSRSAQLIAPQLASSIAQLRAVVLHISAASQLSPPPPPNTTTANQNK